MAERLRTSRTEAEAVIDRFIGAGETLLAETEIVHDAASARAVPAFVPIGESIGEYGRIERPTAQAWT